MSWQLVLQRAEHYLIWFAVIAVTYVVMHVNVRQDGEIREIKKIVEEMTTRHQSMDNARAHGHIINGVPGLGVNHPAVDKKSCMNCKQKH